MTLEASVRGATRKSTMAKSIFRVPDIEHEGDLQHYESLIIDNGGKVIKTVWSGEPDDDAYIIYEAETDQQVSNIRQILEQ